MNAYQELRARQRARDSFVQANPHVACVNTHRVTLLDDSCAEEGGKFIPNSEEWTQGHGPIPKVPRNRKAVAPWIGVGPALGLLSVLLVAGGAAFVLVFA